MDNGIENASQPGERFIEDAAVISNLEEMQPRTGYELGVESSTRGYGWLSSRGEPKGALKGAVDDILGRNGGQWWKNQSFDQPFAYGYFGGSYWKFYSKPGKFAIPGSSLLIEEMREKKSGTPIAKPETASQEKTHALPTYGDFENKTGLTDQALQSIRLLPAFSYDQDEAAKEVIREYDRAVNAEIERLGRGNTWLTTKLKNAYFGIPGLSDETQFGEFFKHLRKDFFAPGVLQILNSPLQSKLYFVGCLRTLAEAKKAQSDLEAHLLFSALVKPLYGEQLPAGLYAEPVTEEEILSGTLGRNVTKTKE